MENTNIQSGTQENKYTETGLVDVNEVIRSADQCLECTSDDCAFNNGQVCRYALVYGEAPKITEHDGCTCGVYYQ